MNPKTFGKYFAHGICYQISLLFFGVGWLVVLTGLIAIGSIIGFIIGILLIFLIIGALNTFLTDRIWGYYLSAGLKDLVLHGLVLFLGLLIVNAIVVTLPLTLVHFLVNEDSVIMGAEIITFLVAAPVDGIVARIIGLLWEESERRKDEEREPAEAFFGARTPYV